MEPVFILDDSEDEGCIYLKQVQNEAVRYLSRSIKLGESSPCEDSFLPTSKIPKNYKLPLTDSQKSKILLKFSDFRQKIRENLFPKETKRSKKIIKATLYDTRPLFQIIKELDQLTV